MQAERAGADHAAAADLLRRGAGGTRGRRASPGSARESELASARIEHEWRSRSIRAREQELAGLEARLKSLEELEAARAEYDDAARAVLAQANGKVGQQGAVADYLEVNAGLRAGGRSLSRRPAAARRRRKRRTRRRRVSAAPRAARRPLRIPDRIDGPTAPTSRQPHRADDGRCRSGGRSSSVVNVTGPFARCDPHRARRCVDRADLRACRGGERATRCCRSPPPTAMLFRGPHRVSGGVARGRARHPRDEAGHQGSARPDRRRARRARPPGR